MKDTSIRSNPYTIDPAKLSAAFKNRDLCARTGTCVGICPEEALYVNDVGFPELIAEKCTSCGICARTCPGETVHFRDMARRTFEFIPEDTGFDGHVTDTRIAYSTDKTIRSGGAGGGVATAILWDLLKAGEVDGCVVTRMCPERPWLAEPFIATTYQELTSSQGSKYLVIALNSILETIRSRRGCFAVAALPCQVHGLRKAMEAEPWLKEKIKVLVGLFCGGALEPEVVTDLLRTKGLTKEEISDFQFRGGEWPGKMRAVKKDGTICNMHYSNYKDGAYNYFIGLYMPMRCQTCIDGSNEFADLAVSDAWTKNQYGEYKFRGCSRILIRTPLGAEIVRNADARGTIGLIDLEKDANYRTQKQQTRRKGIIAPLRVDRLGKKGAAVPRYDRPVPEATTKERLSEQGVTSLLYLARKTGLRYYLIKFLTSYYAIPLIKLRLWLKNRKYQKRRG